MVGADGSGAKRQSRTRAIGPIGAMAWASDHRVGPEPHDIIEMRSLKPLKGA
jgi:hypothetical protein